MTLTLNRTAELNATRFLLLKSGCADRDTSSIRDAWDNYANQHVALKLAKPGARREQLEQEAACLARLNHPQIVRLLDDELCHSDELGDFIVLEWLAGRNLHSVIDSGRTMGEDRLVVIAQQMCGAMSMLHHRRLIHGDIKPSNVIWTSDHGAVLIDFETVRPFGRAATDSQYTARYAAPESTNAHQVDGRSDIFSLGVTLYELASGGYHPFTEPGESMDALAVATRVSIRQPRPLGNHVPIGLRDTIMTALASDPADRFPTAQAMAQELADLYWAVGP